MPDQVIKHESRVFTRPSVFANFAATRIEILDSLSKPTDYIVAIAEVTEGGTHRVHYLRRPFQREPDFGVTSVNYSFAELLTRATGPA